MDDEYEDVPDDFFDDFSNADFIEGLNVIDSWEPPLESLPPKNDIIVIDDLDDCKIIDEYNQSSNDNVASNGTDKAEESLEKDSDALRNRSSSRHRERLRFQNRQSERSPFRKFEAPVRKYKNSPLRTSPQNETKKPTSYYDRISKSKHSNASQESRSKRSPSHRRRRSRDHFMRSRRSASRDRRLRLRSRSKDYYDVSRKNRNRSRSRTRSRNRSRSRRRTRSKSLSITRSRRRSRSRSISRRRRNFKDAFRLDDDDRRGHHSRRSLDSFSISPELDHHKKRHAIDSQKFDIRRQDPLLNIPTSSAAKELKINTQPVMYSPNQTFESEYNMTAVTCAPQMPPFQYYPQQPYPINPQFMQMTPTYMNNAQINVPGQNLMPVQNLQYNFNQNANIALPTIPEQKSLIKNEPVVENKAQVARNKVEIDAKKLFAEKKLSLSEFLTMSAKRIESSDKDTGKVENKVKILSRCNEVLSYLNELERFPKEFIYNDKRYADFQRIINPALQYCSPLRKIKVSRFRFTTMPEAILKNKTQRIRSYMRTMNIKCNDSFKSNTTVTSEAPTQVPGKYHKFVQTDKYDCLDCKIRKETKMVDQGCQVNVEELRTLSNESSTTRFDDRPQPNTFRQTNPRDFRFQNVHPSRNNIPLNRGLMNPCQLLNAQDGMDFSEDFDPAQLDLRQTFPFSNGRNPNQNIIGSPGNSKRKRNRSRRGGKKV